MSRKTIDIEFIIVQLDKKIKKHVRETEIGEREDLSQEIKIKIIEKLDSLLYEDVPGFCEFIDSESIIDNYSE